MSTQHTPGPWTYEPGRDNLGDTDYQCVLGSIQSPDMYHIARVWNDGPHPEMDARLIAAAPDLMAACVDLVQLWDSWAEHSTQLAEPLHTSIKMRVDQARAAIALTKGE